MAKKRANKIKKKTTPERPVTKECWVKLKRLSPQTIDYYLKPNNITHNVGAEIKGCTLRIGNATIKSKNLAFNVCMKLHENGITVTESQTSGRRVKFSPKILAEERNEKSNLTVAVRQPKPIVKLIDEAWRKCKLNRQKKVQLNDVVMAKMKGHPAWPSLILDFVTASKAKVEFYGADPRERFGFIGLNEIVHYSECLDVLCLTLKRDFIHAAKFRKGVHESEIVLGVPTHASLLN